MKKIEEKIILFIKEYSLISRGDKVLVALSGGPDSVFLLYFLLKFQKKYRIKIGAVHINHMIRDKEAENDEKFCRNLCSQWKVDYHSIKRDVPAFAKSKKISLEAAARNVRYHEIGKVQREFGYDKIATGHNCSDNAETILLNLIKGAGIKGLSGIPIKRNSIIRPILPLTKKEILGYLNKNRMSFVIDKTNLDSAYGRNVIRNELLPLIKKQFNPRIEQTLFKQSLLLKKQSTAIEFNVRAISDFIAVYKKNKMELDVESLSKLEEDIKSDVVKYCVERNFSVQISFNDCKKIISLITNSAAKSAYISNGLKGLRERNKILIFPYSEEVVEKPVVIKIGETKRFRDKEISMKFVNKPSVNFTMNKLTEFVNADKLDSGFKIRVWKAGDKFQPIGMMGRKNVSDFLSDLKMSSLEKKQQPVLINKKKIVWVIGQRLDERFKITNDTRKILQICVKMIKVK